MTANLSNRRIDDYGPVHPWRSNVPKKPMVSEQELADARQYLAWLKIGGGAAAGVTPSLADDELARAFGLMADRPSTHLALALLRRAIREGESSRVSLVVESDPAGSRV